MSPLRLPFHHTGVVCLNSIVYFFKKCKKKFSSAKNRGACAPLSVSKNHVIASQCAHWRGNPYPLQGGALRVPSAHRRPLGVVSLYERQRERIATPACGLVRDDICILGFFYSLRGACAPLSAFILPVLPQCRYPSRNLPGCVGSGRSRCPGTGAAAGCRSSAPRRRQ